MTRRTPVRNWVLLMARQLVMALATAAGLVVLARQLSPAAFALYGYATLAFSVAQSVGDLGFGARTILTGDDAEIRRRAGTVLVVWSLVVAVICAGLVGIKGVEAGAAGALFGAGLSLLSLQTLQGAVLEREGRFGAVGLVEAAQRIVFVLGAIIAVVGFHSGGIGIAAAVGVAGAVGYLMMGRAVGGLLIPARPASLGGFSTAWFQGRLANQFTYGAYVILGPALLSARDLGLVVWALSVSALPAIGAALVARAVLPSLAGVDARRHVAAYRAVFRLYLPMSLPFVAILFAFAEPLTRTVFGVKWLAAVGVLRLECATTTIGLVLTPLAPLLYVWLSPREARNIMFAFAAGSWTLALAYSALAPDLYVLSLASVTAALVTVIWVIVRLQAAGRTLNPAEAL